MHALLGKERWLQWNSQNVDEIDDEMPWTRKLEYLLLVLDEEQWEAERKARDDDKEDWSGVIKNGNEMSLSEILELIDIISIIMKEDEEENGDENGFF